MDIANLRLKERECLPKQRLSWTVVTKMILLPPVPPQDQTPCQHSRIPPYTARSLPSSRPCYWPSRPSSGHLTSLASSTAVPSLLGSACPGTSHMLSNSNSSSSLLGRGS